MKKTLTSEQYNFWDTVIKAISAILTIGTIIIGVFSYLENQKAELKQKEKDFRVALAEKQLGFYTELSDCVGEIVASLDSFSKDSLKVKRTRFLQLYYGKMNLVESKPVDEAIKKFRTCLDDFIADNKGVHKDEVSRAAFDINKACRNSIMTTWDVHLDNLTK